MKQSYRWLSALGVASALSCGVVTQSPAQAPIARRAQPVAPELVGNAWLNTPGGKPISLSGRRGQVTVVQFWTFGCSNCRVNLPIYARLFEKFEKRGVTVIGVHTPESDYERDPQNVAAQVKSLSITYPVLLDAGSENWRKWGQQYWPTLYIADKAGRVRGKWIGELNYGSANGEAQVVASIEKFLAERLTQTCAAI